MPRTILLTGATGFLGRHVLPLLAEHVAAGDAQVHAVASRPIVGVDGVTFHPCDLLDQEAVRGLLHEVKPSDLVHLAWFNGESASRYADGRNFDWVSATEMLVRAFADEGGTRAVIAGSCIEYGPAGGVLNEDTTEARPDTVYGRCKLDSGLRALAIADSVDELSLAVARVFFVLGRHEEPTRLVPTVARHLLRGEQAELSARTQRRDYMHADDVARAMIALLDSDLEGHVNVGMGAAVSVRELAETIAEVIGEPELLWFGARPGGPDIADEITADISKLSNATGWAPQLDIPAAAADVVEFWRQELAARSTH